MEKIKAAFKGNKNIANNIIGAFAVRGGSLVVALFTMPAYLRYFENQSVLGLWFTILAVLNWILMFDLGLGNGLRNKLPLVLAKGDSVKAQKYISSTYISTAILVLVICVVSFVIFPYIPWNSFFNIDRKLISHEVLVNSVKIVFTGIMIQLLLKLITSILYALQKSAVVNLLGLLSNIIILGFVSYAPTRSIEQNLINMSWINVLSVNIPLVIASIVIFSTTLKNCRPSFKKYNNKFAAEILKVGSVLLWLQVVFMTIASTNEFLISRLTNPSSVVEYQVYNKIFTTISSIFIIALAPVWSAVTKAQSEKNYSWIERLSNILLATSLIAFIGELTVIPMLQVLTNVWLGSSAIHIRTGYAVIFAVYNGIYILHNVNASLGNGMSFFRTQLIWMTFAAVVNIPLSYLLVHLTGGWIGVVIANILSLLPFEVLEPIYFHRHITKQKLQIDKTILSEGYAS